MLASAIANLTVMALSSGDGSTNPEGWLCYVKLGFMWIDFDLGFMEGIRSCGYGRTENFMVLPYST